MLKTIFTILFSFTLFINYSQTISGNLVFDGEKREYNVYLPSSYDGSTPLPLIINMHGLGSNAVEQAVYSRFNSFADLNGFIVVYPEGLEATVPEINYTGQHWNAYFETGVDDIGFIDFLIDVLWNRYTIDITRVYATGMSNGGFMSYTLACELSDRIAAIASVTGSMVDVVPQECDSERPVPVLQFHGTVDPVVPYEGEGSILSMEDVIDYWVEQNGCTADGVTGVDLEDTNPDDNSTVTRFLYDDCGAGGQVDFYRINNGGHTWPGALIILDEESAGPTNRDINATALISELFNSITHPNPRQPEVITSNDLIAKDNDIVYPNVFENHLNLNLKKPAAVTLMRADGRIMEYWNAPSGLSRVDASAWPNGLYLLQISSSDGGRQIVKLIK